MSAIKGIKVSPKRFSEEIVDIMYDYMRMTYDKLDDVVHEVALETKDEIKRTSPVGYTGEYKSGWIIRQTRKDLCALSYTVANRNRWQLTHLLEFGHAKRNGGRVKAYPHIAPARGKAEKNLESKISEALKQ